MVCPHGQGGVEPERTFWEKGRIILAISCGRLLWTALYAK